MIIIKRALRSLMALGMAFCLSSSAASLQLAKDAAVSETRLLNICAHADYTVSLRNAVYCYEDIGGRMLTDLKYSAIKEDKTEGWVGIKSYNGSADYKATVDIKLNYEYRHIYKFYIRFAKCKPLGADMPLAVKFYTSEDGEKFSYIGEASTKTDTNDETVSAVYECKPSGNTDAAYIRVVFENKGGVITLINEIGAAVNATEVRANSDGNIITDRNGIIYEIGDGGASVIGSDVNIPASGESGSINPTETDICHDGEIFTLGIGSENEVRVINDFIDESCAAYSGVPNNIKYIVIHNTATVEESTTAERYNYIMHRKSNESSWHYTVDENEIYHSLSDYIVGWHAGANYNYESIGIEICVCGAPMSGGNFVFTGSAYEKWVKNRFDKSMRNAAMLTSELLVRYGLTPENVIQHYDVTEKNCPLWMRASGNKFVHDGTNWITFMGYVNDYYKRLCAGAYVAKGSETVLPEYILDKEGVLHPLTAIKSFAFEALNTEKLFIPEQVCNIDPDAFSGYEYIAETVISEKNIFYYTDGKTVYDINGVIVFDSESSTEKPSPDEGCTLDIRQIGKYYYIFLESGNVTLREVAENYGAEYYSGSYGGKSIADDDILFTGASVKLGAVLLYPILRGDISGDGKINSIDYAVTKRSCLGTYAPSRQQIAAVAFKNGTKITSNDYAMLKRYVLGTFDIRVYA